MNKRFVSLLSLVALFFLPVTVFAQELEEIVAPTGFMALLTIVPLIIVLVLLFLKVDMIIAGIVGGMIAMIIGGIGIADANAQLLEAIPTMLESPFQLSTRQLRWQYLSQVVILQL